MGFISFVLVLYFIRVMIVLLTKFILIKAGKKNIYKILKKNLFFNIILTITMEVYIEIIINSFINIQQAKFNLLGEKLASIMSYLSIFFAAIFLPGSLVYIFIFKSQKNMQSE